MLKSLNFFPFSFSFLRKELSPERGLHQWAPFKSPFYVLEVLTVQEAISANSCFCLSSVATAIWAAFCARASLWWVVAVRHIEVLVEVDVCDDIVVVIVTC